MPKKFTILSGLTLFIFSFIFASLAHPVAARDPLQGVANYTRDVFNPAIETQDVNLQSTTYEMFLSLISSITKSTFITCDELQLRDPNAICQSPTGTIPTLYSLNVRLATTPPVSTSQYLANVGSRLHLVQPAYAQGLGPTGLQPVLEIWRGFRNIAYFLATIGFVLLSFAIMFRVRLSPQTVVTAQTALSKLVIVFLAITFSYALAGLMVDLIFVVSFLIISLFRGAGLISAPINQVQQNLFSGNPLTLLGSLLASTKPAGDYINALTEQLFSDLNVPNLLQWFADHVFSDLFDSVSQLIISIAIIFSLFRLFIQLLLAYIEIILLTILGPLMILADILPGGRGLSSWLKQLLANVMAFPTVTFMFLLGILLVGGNDRFGVGGAGINLESGVQLPFLNFSPDILRGFLGIGIILMTPQAVKMVKDAFKAESFFAKYTPAIGAAIGVGVARGVTAPWQQATQGLSLQKQAAQKIHAEYKATGSLPQGAKAPGWLKRRFGI
jgi:hypothetical protein